MLRNAVVLLFTVCFTLFVAVTAFAEIELTENAKTVFEGDELFNKARELLKGTETGKDLWDKLSNKAVGIIKIKIDVKSEKQDPDLKDSYGYTEPGSAGGCADIVISIDETGGICELADTIFYLLRLAEILDDLNNGRITAERATNLEDALEDGTDESYVLFQAQLKKQGESLEEAPIISFVGGEGMRKDAAGRNVQKPLTRNDVGLKIDSNKKYTVMGVMPGDKLQFKLIGPKDYAFMVFWDLSCVADGGEGATYKPGSETIQLDLTIVTVFAQGGLNSQGEATIVFQVPNEPGVTFEPHYLQAVCAKDGVEDLKKSNVIKLN